MNQIRIRYAPSPTGYLHLGNARTALFVYLMARHYQGATIMRIEDTDLNRNRFETIESQYRNLKWLGITFDESYKHPGNYGPYLQSQRLKIYQKYVQQLITSKQAYYCFCTSQELDTIRDQQLKKGIRSFRYSGKCSFLTTSEVKAFLVANKPYNIRIKSPKKTQLNFHDLVRGSIHFDSSDFDDWIIIKSNSYPTYNFAVVIDDYLMKISHVVRGEEHVSNTPRQIIIYKALKWKVPTFAHLTLIVDQHRKKMSKRDAKKNFFINQFRADGYLPQAIFNFLALLGWAPPEEQEIFSRQQLVKIFDETRFSKSNSIFSLEKLQWINKHYLQKLNAPDFQSFITPFLQELLPNAIYSLSALMELTLLFKKQLSYGREIIHILQPWVCTQNLSKSNLNLIKSFNRIHEIGTTLIKELVKIIPHNFHEDNIKKAIKTVGQHLNIQGKKLFKPVRIFITLKAEGPEIGKIATFFKKELVLQNIKTVLALI